MRILKTRSDLNRARLNDKNDRSWALFNNRITPISTCPNHQIAPLGSVSQWGDPSQMDPLTKGPTTRVDFSIIQATSNGKAVADQIGACHNKRRQQNRMVLQGRIARTVPPRFYITRLSTARPR